MRVFFLTLFGALAMLAQNVTVEFDPAADFSHYRTFAIRDGQLNSKNPALNNRFSDCREAFPTRSRAADLSLRLAGRE
jgi:hypothetical protein